MPRAVQERLTAGLAEFKNREAAFVLAVVLARNWSAPARLLSAFPIDRRKIVGRADLGGLTESHVRGAIATLIKMGYLAREEPEPGKRFRRTAQGWQRLALLYRFQPEYGSTFAKANAAAQAARRALAPNRRPIAPSEPRPAAQTHPIAQLRPFDTGARPSRPYLAHKEDSNGNAVIMGEQREEAEKTPLEGGLAAAFERLERLVNATETRR